VGFQKPARGADTRHSRIRFCLESWRVDDPDEREQDHPVEFVLRVVAGSKPAASKSGAHGEHPHPLLGKRGVGSVVELASGVTTITRVRDS
jgi:hypothetical protein